MILREEGKREMITSNFDNNLDYFF